MVNYYQRETASPGASPETEVPNMDSAHKRRFGRFRVVLSGIFNVLFSLFIAGISSNNRGPGYPT